MKYCNLIALRIPFLNRLPRLFPRLNVNRVVNYIYYFIVRRMQLKHSRILGILTYSFLFKFIQTLCRKKIIGVQSNICIIQKFYYFTSWVSYHLRLIILVQGIHDHFGHYILDQDLTTENRSLEYLELTRSYIIKQLEGIVGIKSRMEYRVGHGRRCPLHPPHLIIVIVLPLPHS